MLRSQTGTERRNAGAALARAESLLEVAVADGKALLCPVFFFSASPSECAVRALIIMNPLAYAALFAGLEGDSRAFSCVAVGGFPGQKYKD